MNTAPKIGQKVYPLPNEEGNWLGVPDYYHDKIGVVTSVETYGTARTIRAEFKSVQKPDDTVAWNFRNFKPAYEMGDAVRVIGGSAGDMIGRVGTLFTAPDKDSVSVLVNGVSPSMPGENYWMDIQDIEPVLDGETATVSDSEYVPAVGDNVRVTGYLADDGIRDGLDWRATVQKIDGEVWSLHNVHRGHFVSGPGYVFPVPAEPVEPAIITDLQEQIDTLKRELERANERVTALSERAGKWERDFNRHAGAVLQEAIDRDWCDEYERVMDGIQNDLEIAVIPQREQEYEIEVEITASASYTTTVTVTARSQEDAEEIVRDDVDSYVDDPESILSNNIRYASIDNVECEVL